MHLTTAITEIELYFVDNVTIREIQVDLKRLKNIVDNIRNREKAPAKGQGTKGKQKVAALGDNHDDVNDLTQEATTDALFEALDIDEETFMQGYSKLYAILSRFPFELEHRLNSDPGVRLLAMSGLTWNTKTKNRYRDQAHIAIAAALEYRIVKEYRQQLLQACPYARKMRSAVYEYLNDNAALYQSQSSSMLVGRREWSFPDNIPSDFGELESDVPFDPKDAWTVELDLIPGTSRRKNHPIHSVVDELLDHPLLRSSEQGVPNGTVELCAYYVIQGLARVIIFLYYF